MVVKLLTLSIPAPELDNLEKYCQQCNRTKTDLIEEYLRYLNQLLQSHETKPSTEQLLSQINTPHEPIKEANQEKLDLEILLEIVIEHSTNLQNQLHKNNQQMLKYLQQVEKVTAAAAAVENDCFESDSLNEVATRSDELGQLARVFQRMVQTLKDREQELSEAKEQLEAVLNAVPGSISWINTNGVYLGVNKHLAENLNLLPENVNGQKLEFFKSQSQFAQFMSKFLSSQQTAASQEIEVQINNSKRYYLIAAQKYQQGNAAVTVGIDITDRKRAQEALRIAEENYRSIFENALDGIFQSTFDGHYINVNPAMAQIHGYDSPQEMMVTVAEIGSQLYVEPSCRQDFQRLMEAQGEVKGFEYQVYQRDGNIIWVEENTRAVGDTNGNLFYYEGIIQDITKRKQEEDALKQQVQDLRIEIDQQKRVCQVAAITQTDYFREIQAEIESMRFDEDF